ncbi:MAG: hypothetical protein IT371_18520 [Deltaproteobacteria bacterium]|nr:hypothetical protein [Deltaproteobacteria bacterium]
MRRSPGLVRELSEILGTPGDVVPYHDGKHAAATVRRFVADGGQVLAVCGGDGTLMQLASELAELGPPERLPRVVVLPAGTVNTLARNLGVRGDPCELLRRLVSVLRAGGREELFSSGTLRVGTRCGFIFGAAMPARFMALYDRAGPGGPARAARLGLRVSLAALFGTRAARELFDPVPAVVEVDGTRLLEPHFTLLVAASVEDVGLGIKLTYRARERPNAFHLVASALPARTLAREFPRTFLGRPLRGVGHHDHVAERVSLEFLEPQPYLLDGELFTAETLELRAGPRLRFGRP